jgi:septal ring factor EnvC (AmiA/AmiB activator)
MFSRNLLIFRKFLYSTVFCIFGLFLTFPSTAQNYDSQAQKIDKEIKRIQKEQQQQRKDKQKVSAQLRKTNKELNKVSKQLNQLDSDIKNQEELVIQLKTKRESNKNLQINAQDSLAALMLEHTKTQTPKFLQFLLAQKKINNIDRQQIYFKYFSNARQQQINLIRIDLQGSEKTTQEYEQRKQELQKQYGKQKKLQKNITTSTTKKAKILKELESNIAQNTSTIKQLKANRKRLSALITKLQKQRQASSKKEFIPVRGGFSKQKGRMLYPINGKVITSYGKKNNVTGLSSNGLAIKANKAGNNSVRSIYEGRVIFSNWLKGFGNLIIVEHGQGYMSLYGNNQTLNKKEGDIVNAREVIAVYQQKSKSSFYFEIRNKGKATNPKSWLK